MIKINSKPCRICVIIRFFIFAMMLLLLVALLAKDKLHHLSFITSMNIAIAIMVFGVISFIIKYILWKKELNQKSNDSLQNE